MEKEIIEFKQWKCFLELGHYTTNDRLSITLCSAETNGKKDVILGEPIIGATVNIPDVNLKENEIIIRNDSYHEGILDTLKNAGFISDVVKEVSSGFVDFQVVEKTPKLIELENTIQKKNKPS